MKSILVSLFVASFVFIFSLEAKPVKIGQSLPGFNQGLLNIDGNELKLEDLKGSKGTLVIFTCNHCPYVKAWESRMISLGNEFSAKGVSVLMVNSNDPTRNPEDSYTEMQARAKARGMKFPYVVDLSSNMARVFGAEKTPEIFLFDSSAKLVYKGAVDDNSEDASKVESHYLKEALTSLVEKKPISKAETKAMGCGIKFRKS